RSDESVQFFADLVDQKKRDLDEKSDLLKNFKQDNKFFDIEMESQSQLNQIAEQETKLAEENNEVQSLEVSLRNIKSKLNRINGGGNPNADVQRINKNVLQLRNRIQALNEKYVMSGASDQELLDSLTNLRQNLKIETEKLSRMQVSDSEQPSLAELENQKEQIETALEIARSKVATTQQTLSLLKYRKSDFASKEAVIANLQREVNVASEEYLSAQEKYNNARNESLASGKGIRQIMQGQPANDPESRKVLITTLFAIVASVGLTIFTIVLIEYLDFSIKTPERFKSIVKLPLIGQVNTIHKAKHYDPPRVFNESGDQESDAFRHLLRKFRYELENSEHKKFLITSARVGAGKSFVIISLAYSLSLIHKKILIVDTNFKSNFLTKSLKTDERVKLLDDANLKLLSVDTNS
ncbi:hypothetical protein, partial [Fulvivirga lutimaris]|uniref:hypothetical protein n=1 Tax=Fulvivirga lutimaris TaxID=1819566 RepID=UPI00162A8E55